MDPPGTAGSHPDREDPYLVDEGGKLVVEGLDLLLLLSTHSLDVGVHLQLEGAQQALVYGDCCDAPHTTSPAIAAAESHVGAQAPPEAAAAAHPGEAGGADAGTGPTRV